MIPLNKSLIPKPTLTLLKEKHHCVTVRLVFIFLGFSGGVFLCSPAAYSAPSGNGITGNTLCLNAPVSAERGLYNDIESVFGKGAVEAPSDSIYSPPRPHVTVGTEESVVKSYFAVLAIEPTDVNLDKFAITDGGDRSRTEIKLAPGRGPQASFHAKEGDIYIYSWRFKIVPGMRFSSGFTHLHQIMAQGGSLAGQPLITFTARSDGQLSILHSEMRLKNKAPKLSSHLTVLGRIPLSKIVGSWIDVKEKIFFSAQNGRYELTIKDQSGKDLLSIDRSELSTWRKGANHMRPKWGIYRKHDAALNQGAADYVYFANFAITRGDSPDSTCR